MENVPDEFTQRLTGIIQYMFSISENPDFNVHIVNNIIYEINKEYLLEYFNYFLKDEIINTNFGLKLNRTRNYLNKDYTNNDDKNLIFFRQQFKFENDNICRQVIQNDKNLVTQNYRLSDEDDVYFFRTFYEFENDYTNILTQMDQEFIFVFMLTYGSMTSLESFKRTSIKKYFPEYTKSQDESIVPLETFFTKNLKISKKESSIIAKYLQ